MIRLLTCLLALFALTACQPPVRLMPPPALFLNGEHNLFGANANLDQSPQIQVFYATNRAAFGPSAAPVYTVFPGDQLHLGTATLDIGGGGQTWDWLYAQSTGAAGERRPQILVNAMQRQASVATAVAVDAPGDEALAYFKAIDAALASSADPDLIGEANGGTGFTQTGDDGLGSSTPQGPISGGWFGSWTEEGSGLEAEARTRDRRGRHAGARRRWVGWSAGRACCRGWSRLYLNPMLKNSTEC